MDNDEYKNEIDPPKNNGGEAEYFATDWKAHPIDIFLDKMVKEELNKNNNEDKSS